MTKQQAQMGYLLTFTQIESIEHVTKTGELCIEQKRGIITLLPKKTNQDIFSKIRDTFPYLIPITKQ